MSSIQQTESYWFAKIRELFPRRVRNFTVIDGSGREKMKPAPSGNSSSKGVKSDF